MTPLRFAQALAADLSTLPVPTPIHAQLGDVVVPCAGTYVSILNQTEVDLGNNCDKIQMAEVVVVAARDCANVSYDDGTTNWDAQNAVSAQMDFDADLLLEQAEKWRADGVVPPRRPDDHVHDPRRHRHGDDDPVAADPLTRR